MAFWSRPFPPASVAAPGSTVALSIGDHRAAARLTDIHGGGASVACATRAPLGARVTLAHPDAGTLAAEVTAIGHGGMRLRFEPGARATGFALAMMVATAAARREAA